MKRALVGAAATWLVLLGCESTNDTVDVSIAKETQASILNVVPAKEYAFYVLSASRPQPSEDLSYWSLLVCASDIPDIDVRLIMYASVATKGMPFKSTRVFSIAQGASCKNTDEPCSRGDTTLYVDGPGKIQIPLTRSEVTFSANASLSRVFEQCYEALQKNPKSVLLTKRILGLRKLKELVELKFN